jgi:hypothetical protein
MEKGIFLHILHDCRESLFSYLVIHSSTPHVDYHNVWLAFVHIFPGYCQYNVQNV